MVSVVKNLNLKVSADMIKPIMQLFDEDRSGTVDYQEFFALIFYFQGLKRISWVMRYHVSILWDEIVFETKPDILINS